MEQLNREIFQQAYNGLQISKLPSNSECQVLSISLEKGAIFPEHISPRNVQLVVLEGKIQFHINGEDHDLQKFDHFRFLKETPHWVEAEENSKFLIIR